MIPSLKAQVCRPSPALRGADRPAAAALAGCQAGQCVWTHDFAPARDTAIWDVACRVVVGVSNETAPTTDERRLRAPVSPVNPPARVTFLRRVGGIDPYESRSSPSSIAGEVLAKPGECPRVHRGPLGLAKPYPLADATEVLDGDAAPGAFSLGHDALADLVVDVGGDPLLFAAALLEQPSRGGGLLGLQPFPDALLSFAVPVRPCSGHPVTVGCGRDV
ncbi:hypothetical protein H4W33_008751 [Kibdelosporangium phytohabitans]|nr:hypothetical protein [Kibdelosporangium phytohabitans]MBE1469677.1 hypothetical protein [Kibdelosporangium phytohabitans]